jgi:hypothetical protein
LDSDLKQTRKEQIFMQTLTFLCFELQVAPRRLRETFAQSQVPAKTRQFAFTKPGRDAPLRIR